MPCTEAYREHSKRIRITAIENGHIDRDTEDSISWIRNGLCSGSSGREGLKPLKELEQRIAAGWEKR